MSDQSEKEQWPAVDAAFQYVFPSYQLLVTRFEAADSRLTAVMTTLSAFALGAPTFANSIGNTVDYKAVPFWIGISIFTVGTIYGLVARAKGKLLLPDPMAIHDKSLHRSEESFKRTQLYFAGMDFDANANEILRKSRIANHLTVALVCEVFAFIWWLAIS